MATRAGKPPKDSAPLSPGQQIGPAFREFGTSGTAIYGGFVVTTERNPKAIGQQRYVEASNILANISIVAASVRYFLNLLSKAKWKVDPANDTAEAKNAAEFVESVMGDMATHWARIVRRSGMFRFHGFSIQEWTAKRRLDGLIGIANIESRPQKTIWRWSTDAGGSVDGVFQRSPQTGQEFPIPRWKMVYMVDDLFTDSPEGQGWFRHLLEPCERLEKYLKLEAIGFERDLSGIPIGKAPITAINRAIDAGTMTKAEGDQLIAAMKRLVSLQVRKEDTGFVLDSQTFEDVASDGRKVTAVPMWGLELLTGKSESLDALNVAVERLEMQMARIMGTESMLMGGRNSGNRSLGETKSENLALNVNSTLVDMAGFMTADIVDPLWLLNGFDDALKPKMKTEDVAFRDVQEVTTALRDMATAGAILSPDDPAINDVRDLLGIARAPEMSIEDLGALRSAGTQPMGDPNQDPGSGNDPIPGKGKRQERAAA